MSTLYSFDAPPLVQEYLSYLQTIQGKSKRTAYVYFNVIRTFIRYLKLSRGLVPKNTEFSAITINDVSIELLQSVTLAECYQFMEFTLTVRKNDNAARAHKTIALNRYYEYLTTKKKYFDVNPFKEVDSPKIKKSLPKHLTLEQSLELLDSVDGDFKERDYCLLTFLLNCGMRLSEVYSLNYQDIRPDNTLRVIGKGNKERIVYLNSACISAYKNYMTVRPTDGLIDKNALFISKKGNRLCSSMIQKLVYKYLAKIGLEGQGFSCHKLRHTAATLMYQHGDVDIRVLQDILGHENLGTTQIYTHLSSKQMQDAANANPLSKISKKSTNKK